MMDNVVAIIKARLVVSGVDASKTVSVAVSGRISIDKSMLPPVSGHHHKSRKTERDNKYDQSCVPVEEAKNDNQEGTK